ncbi:hypothetical protein Rsub_09285 [Raphidocelis subcapitata]|uniref:Peptide N-acetyl-beta-D-glucosaminyl asparaginase amidase A N-terminal domain-containing protein n=1 Tax=Raphidocelis subcapitata TaxID=307507 RepID=A0A2V0PCI1_9CHLO|nr:hypothetical protein Rsub_09285 [Raphidocelis subcapitata]|eukprot:GBF96652.1 hypothetical protein Rsub_09285 [Raphidocelis subcapitata]
MPGSLSRPRAGQRVQMVLLALLVLATVARAQRESARGALDLLPALPPAAASPAPRAWLQLNFLCDRDPTANPLSDAGCTNVTAGELHAWGIRGLPAGVVEVRRGPPDFAANPNGGDGARRRLLAPPSGSSPNWAFPADTTTCVKATDVQRASLIRTPSTAACGTVDLVGAAAGNVAASFRPFPPGPNLNSYPDIYVGCSTGKCSSAQCQAGATCQTGGYYTQVMRPDPVRTPSSCGAQAIGSIILNVEFRVPAGRQYDRSVGLWVNDAVLFHGTTSQPAATCTTWTLRRDVSHLRALFAPPADAAAPSSGVMMELDNTVSSATGLTSPFWVRAWLDFYPADAAPAVPPPPPADAVLPLANAAETWGRWFMTAPVAPSANPVAAPLSAAAGLPYRAALEVFADPHSCEEFWFTRPAGYACSESGTTMTNQYRELQVLLDGTPIGIHGIYPVWYTGGYSPETWRAMAGHHAHLGLAYTFDVTPWVHLLANGAPHTFSFQIGNSNANFWYVSANLLLWRDSGLVSLTPSSEPVLATPALSAFALNGGTLTAPRSLSARRSFSASGVDGGGAAFSYSLTAEATYDILTHSNAVTSSTWDNRQTYKTAFTLTRGDGVSLHNVRTDFATANAGRATTRYDFDATLSLNTTDAAHATAAGLSAASAGASRAAKLAHWQGALAPAGSNCKDATGCACAAPALTCGTCRASRARLEVSPLAGAGACLGASRYAAVTSCKYRWLFDTPTNPAC